MLPRFLLSFLASSAVTGYIPKSIDSELVSVEKERMGIFRGKGYNSSWQEAEIPAHVTPTIYEKAETYNTAQLSAFLASVPGSHHRDGVADIQLMSTLFTYSFLETPP